MEVVIKNPPANAGDIRDEGLIPGWRDPLEEGTVTHSSILNSMDRGAWWAAVRVHTESDTTEETVHAAQSTGHPPMGCPAGSRAAPPGMSKSVHMSTCHICILTLLTLLLRWEKKQGGTGKNIPECSRVFQPAEPARLEAQDEGEPRGG